MNRAPLTSVLVLICIIVYVVLAVLSHNPITINKYLLFLLGQSLFTIKHRAYWQIITSIFVHANILHLALNVVFLYYIGSSLERSTSSGFLALSFFISGLTGNLISLIVGQVILNLQYISVGASGAILGLASSLILYSYEVSGGEFQRAIFSLILLFVLNSLGGNIDVLAHLGGILGGALVGLIYGIVHKRTLMRRAIRWHLGEDIGLR
ncbi:MAG: rhomboid family intramembrane serine protease [Thermoprotei archaeon]|nr:rhomboid family intramembrane serine protease [Thermoprotei archaeon]